MSGWAGFPACAPLGGVRAWKQAGRADCYIDDELPNRGDHQAKHETSCCCDCRGLFGLFFLRFGWRA